MFTSLAIEDVFETAGVSTDVLAQCLTDPEHAIHTVKSNKDHLLNEDYSHLLFSAQRSRVIVAHIASRISWHCLRDIALDRGVKGTQSVFKELSCPISCFNVLSVTNF